jgi:hypothetical protein
VSGKAAPLVGGPPGMELHTVVEVLPGGVVGGTFPVVVIGAGIEPNGTTGVIIDVEIRPSTVGGVRTGIAVTEGDGGVCIIGGSCAGIAVAEAVGTIMTAPPFPEVEELTGIAIGDDVVTIAAGTVPLAPAIEDREVTGTTGVPGAICPVGAEQVTTVPGVVGSEVSGTGASVVSGAPG